MRIASHSRLVAAQLLALALSLAVGACSNRGAAEATVTPVAESTATVTPTTGAAGAREVPEVLLLTGTLLADEESQVTPIVAGRVVEVMVERGAIVEEGQPLVRLRDTDYRLQAAAARASLEQARARLGIGEDGTPPPPDSTPEVQSALAQMQQADESLRRAEELAQRGVFTPAQLDEARARALSARAQHTAALQGARAAIASLASARTALSQASTAVTESVVRAPFAGEIATRDVSPGEQATGATRLVTLVRTDPLRLEVQVPQERLLDVREGQRVEVHVAGIDARTFEGTVRYISASFDRASRGLVVEAVVPNGDRTLRPGMFAEAHIHLGRSRTLAVVPTAAVSTEAGVSRVFVIAEGRIQERVVRVHTRGDGEVVIDEGLAPGETIAVEGVDALADGMRVGS